MCVGQLSDLCAFLCRQDKLRKRIRISLPLASTLAVAHERLDSPCNESPMFVHASSDSFAANRCAAMRGDE
jgi:hypothetical protein